MSARMSMMRIRRRRMCSVEGALMGGRELSTNGTRGYASAVHSEEPGSKLPQKDSLDCRIGFEIQLAPWTFSNRTTH